MLRIALASKPSDELAGDVSDYFTRADLPVRDARASYCLPTDN